MSSDVIVGLGVLVAALAALTGLTLWSRRTIRRIAERGRPTLRQILKDMNGEP
jgi:hypothetical protein